MSLLVAGLVLFVGIHFLPAWPAVRASTVARLGEQRYKGLFSLISAAGLVLIVVGFAMAPATQRVFAPVSAAITVAPYAMALSFVLFAAANMRGYIRKRIQHPMLLGLLIWATVHLLANGDLRGTVLFGSFVAYAVIDLVSAVGRHAVKSFVPAIKYDYMAVAGGIAVAIAVMMVHRPLFGVRVVAFGV